VIIIIYYLLFIIFEKEKDKVETMGGTGGSPQSFYK